LDPGHLVLGALGGQEEDLLYAQKLGHENRYLGARPQGVQAGGVGRQGRVVGLQVGKLAGEQLGQVKPARDLGPHLAKQGRIQRPGFTELGGDLHPSIKLKAVAEPRFWLSRPVVWDGARISSGTAFLRARGAAPGLYLVVGEAGSGRSALLRFFARGFAVRQLKHRHCPAPWWAKEPGDWPGALRPRWVVLAEGGEPEAWAEKARHHPVFLAVAPETAELMHERRVQSFLHLVPLARREARRFLLALAAGVRRRTRALPPRQRPRWAESFLGNVDENRAWAEEVAARITGPGFQGLAQPLFLWHWARVAPPGTPGFERPSAFLAAVLEALQTHTGQPLDLDAARALARLRPRPAVPEAVLKATGLLEGVKALARAGVARRFCPDCWGFVHPAFAAYFLAQVERPTSKDPDLAWAFYLERLPREEAGHALFELAQNDLLKTLRVLGRLGRMLDELLERLCPEGRRTDFDRVAAALDPGMPYEVLERFAQDPLLRWAVAANPGAPPELLRWIYEQALNPETPPRVREGLLAALRANPSFTHS